MCPLLGEDGSAGNFLDLICQIQIKLPVELGDLVGIFYLCADTDFGTVFLGRAFFDRKYRLILIIFIIRGLG